MKESHLIIHAFHLRQFFQQVGVNKALSSLSLVRRAIYNSGSQHLFPRWTPKPSKLITWGPLNIKKSYL